MGFFRNRSFNLIYVHTAMQAIAMHGGEAFAFIYLLKAGLAPALVLFCIGAMFASRILFRRMALPLVLRFGLQRVLVGSILLEASTYPVLARVDSASLLLVAYLAMWAISSSIYWTTYHSYVALLGDNASRGAQVSLMELLGTIMGIVAPAVMGLMLTAFSPLVAFSSVAMVMAGAAIPILMAPALNVAVDAEVPRDARQQVRLMLFSDGLRSGSFHFTWLIALFITLGESFRAFGGAMAFAGLAGALAGLVAGKAVDLGKGLHAARVGFGILAAAAAARALGYGIPWCAVLANAAAAVAWPIYNTGFMSRVYRLSRQSPCPLRFTVVAEGGWDMGTSTACFFSATLVWLGFSFFWPLALSLLSCILGYVVVARSYEVELLKPALEA
jgi:MFS transporter, DHA1 family, inner membrane transport protein